MEIKATDIKNLREKTGAGMMDCKKALVEANGNYAGAEKILREWGMAGVEKRAGRATNEGRIFVKESSSAVALIEIACETDFVARNADFISASDRMVALAFEKGWPSPNAELENMVTAIASIIKENIMLKKVIRVQSRADEFLHTYLHGEGKIGVVVKMKSDRADAFGHEKVLAFIHDIALHIAAFHPMFLDQSKPEPVWIKEQEDIFKKQVELDEKMKTKPANVIQGILKGKLRKLMSEICLLDQGFVKDEKMSVSNAMALVSRDVGAKLEITDYIYLKVGEV
jgi:elongation factor Ts